MPVPILRNQPERKAKMEKHIEALGWIHFVINFSVAMLLLVFTFTGSLFLSLVEIIQHSGVKIPGGIFILVILVLIINLTACVIAGIGVITGHALLNFLSWGRPLGIAFSILDIGLGFIAMFSVVGIIMGLLLMAVGVYGVIILDNEESRRVFLKKSLSRSGSVPPELRS